MHDIRAIRDNPAAFDAAMARRGLAAQSPAILAVDEARRAKIHAAETVQAEQNVAVERGWCRKGERATKANSNACAHWSPKKKAEIAQLNEEAERRGYTPARHADVAAKHALR